MSLESHANAEKYSVLLSKIDVIDTRTNALSSVFDKAFSNLEKISSSLTIVTTHVTVINKEIESLKARLNNIEREINDYNYKFVILQNDSNYLKERTTTLEKKEYEREKRETKDEGSYETIKKIPRIIYYIGCGIFGIVSILLTYHQFQSEGINENSSIHKSIGK